MTTLASNAPFAALRRTVTRASHAMSELIDTLHKAREAQHLLQMSDAQLERRGLTRDGVVAHVFQD